MYVVHSILYMKCKSVFLSSLQSAGGGVSIASKYFLEKNHKLRKETSSQLKSLSILKMMISFRRIEHILYTFNCCLLTDFLSHFSWLNVCGFSAKVSFDNHGEGINIGTLTNFTSYYSL